MIILGVSLVQVEIKDLFIEFRVFPVSAIRLILLPIITFYIISFFTNNAMLIGVATGTAAMPVASMCVMLATLYGGNVKIASLGVLITTFFSVMTIPFMLTYLL